MPANVDDRKPLDDLSLGANTGSVILADKGQGDIPQASTH